MGQYIIGECGNCGQRKRLHGFTDTCDDCATLMRARIEEIRAACAKRRKGRKQKDAQTQGQE